MTFAAPDVVVHPTPPPAALPPCRFRFPDPRRSGAEGLVAAGGDLKPSTLVAAYRAGIFPWPHPGHDLLWWSPDPRAVIPLDHPRVSRRLARTIRAGRFRVTLNAAFDEVVAGCADRDDTWVTPAMRAAYGHLHRLGWAHSVEVWQGDRLAGGLYGVTIGAVFAAESMFHRAPDASKVALVATLAHARRVGMTLFDVQMPTPHLVSLGAVTLRRDDYLGMLAAAVECPVLFAGEQASRPPRPPDEGGPHVQ